MRSESDCDKCQKPVDCEKYDLYICGSIVECNPEEEVTNEM